MSLAHLKDKPALPTVITSSASGSGGGGRFTAARLLGAGTGSRALGFVGGNGLSKLSGGSKSSSSVNHPTATAIPTNSGFDGEGTYLIFNVSDTLFISDVTSHDKASCEMKCYSWCLAFFSHTS